MLRIALTGGIASGKSLVAAELAARGAVIIDADVLAREVVEPGTPALAAIIDKFGPQIMRDGNSTGHNSAPSSSPTRMPAATSSGSFILPYEPERQSWSCSPIPTSCSPCHPAAGRDRPAGGFRRSGHD